MMIGQLNLRTVRTMVLAAALAISASALAQDETTQVLSTDLRAVETVIGIGKNLKIIVSDEYGFTPEQVTKWSRALEAAFDRDLVEADLIAALEDRLSEATGDAALAYAASALGQDVLELVEATPVATEDRTNLDAAQAHFDDAPPKRQTQYLTVFEAENGPERDSAVMDIYFRAMKIAATPIIGAQAADQWVASAEYLRDDYAADHFLASVAVYSQLPADRHDDLVAVLTTPEMKDYAAQLTEALAEALHSATDRLEAEFANEMGR